MAQKGDTPPPKPDFMNPTEVAFLLSRSRGFVYKLVKLGELDAVDLSTGKTSRPALGVTRESYERYLARKVADGRARFRTGATSPAAKPTTRAS